MDEAFPDDRADITAVLAEQFVVPEATNDLARSGVQRTSRNLQRLSVLGVHGTFVSGRLEQRLL